MEAPTLKATRRSATGSRPTRNLRDQGLLPGVIYGRGEDVIPFSVSQHDFEVELIHGHRVLSLDLEGDHGSYLIKEVQFDHLGTRPQHVDLMRVKLTETVKVNVAVVLKGTPKGTKEGGVLDQMTNEVEVECLASQIPDQIVGTVTDLGVDEDFTIAQLSAPDGVKILEDPSTVVATIRTMAEDTPEEETEATEEAEPEVIARGKAEDGTAEDSD